MYSAARKGEARIRVVSMRALLVAALLSGAAMLPSSVRAADETRVAMHAQAPAESIETRQVPPQVPPGTDGIPVALPPMIPATTGVCPQNEPIKAASTEEGERLFYVPNDPTHEGIIPERCFPNEGAAASAGYQRHGF